MIRVSSRPSKGYRIGALWHAVRWFDQHGQGDGRLVYGAPSAEVAARYALVDAFGAERPAGAPEQLEVETCRAVTVRSFSPIETTKLCVDEWDLTIHFREVGSSYELAQMVHARAHLLRAKAALYRIGPASDLRGLGAALLDIGEAIEAIDKGLGYAKGAP